MSVYGRVLLWLAVLLVAAWAADWGADHLAEPLRKIRTREGLTGAAGGALLAMVTAGPEVGINTVSALREVSSIGLGNMLGSNVVSIPVIFSVAYLASRRSLTDEATDDAGAPPSEAPFTHGFHFRDRVLQLEPRTLTVHVLPYLGVLGLVAVLTVPAPLRGLQPIDGWIMLAAYGVYLAHALFRGRTSGDPIEWERAELLLAGIGVGAVIAGAFFAVRATEHLVELSGISEIVGGLFVTATVSTLPEVFNTWHVVRSGQVTAGTTSVLADNTATVTLGFAPLAFVTVPVQDFRLYWVNLLFVALVPAVLAVLLRLGASGSGLKSWQIFALDGVYVSYLVVVAALVLNLP